MKPRALIPFLSALILSTLAATLSLAQSSTMPAHPDTSNPADKSSSGVPADNTFMKTLAAGGIAEVEAGKLAESRASNSEVKEFAQKMVNDHSKNNEQLKALAARKQVALPTTPDAEHTKEKEKLEKQSGAAFDAEYMQGQVKDHQQTVELLQQEIDSGQDASVRSFAQQTLAVVQHHLEMANELQAKLAHSSH